MSSAYKEAIFLDLSISIWGSRRAPLLLHLLLAYPGRWGGGQQASAAGGVGSPLLGPYLETTVAGFSHGLVAMDGGRASTKPPHG